MIRIQKRSPNLWGALRRTIPEQDLFLLDRAFDAVMHRGGELEMDFERPRDASFNPRPARIPLILIHDAGIRDTVTILSGILASAHPMFGIANLIDSVAAVDSREREMVAAALSVVNTLATRPPTGFDLRQKNERLAAIVLLAVTLDRVRHIHQAPLEIRAERTLELQRHVSRLLPLAVVTSPALYRLLQAWNTRWSAFDLISRVPRAANI